MFLETPFCTFKQFVKISSYLMLFENFRWITYLQRDYM